MQVDHPRYKTELPFHQCLVFHHKVRWVRSLTSAQHSLLPLLLMPKKKNTLIIAWEQLFFHWTNYCDSTVVWKQIGMMRPINTHWETMCWNILTFWTQGGCFCYPGGQWIRVTVSAPLFCFLTIWRMFIACAYRHLFVTRATEWGKARVASSQLQIQAWLWYCRIHTASLKWKSKQKMYWCWVYLRSG